MKTIYKLILKSYLGPMILTFFIVMFILMMNFLFRYIDELVGKGLNFGVIVELLFYASATMISMGLPLATLLASIMTMGNLGENNELLAMKCAGMSFPKIVAPLAVVMVFFSVASFFAVNNLVPYSWQKIYTLLYDIRRQSQALEFKEGIFFTGLPDMSIRIDKKHEESGLMEGILIYDTSDQAGGMMTTLADSGYIRLSDDRNYMLITLYHGESYEENRGARNWIDNTSMSQRVFDVQNIVQPVEGFNMERSNDSMFLNANQQTKNIRELSHDIDSLQHRVDSVVRRLNNNFLSNSLFTYNKNLAVDTAVWVPVGTIDLMDSIALITPDQRMELIRMAYTNSTAARSNINWSELDTKKDVTELYKYQANWHQTLALPVSIMLFFLIGAPLGAIIRKGGLGMPIVVSVAFFVIYYVINLFGTKLAKEGTWSALPGMWLSTFVLIPFAVFLTYKATNDSNLLNGDWYYHQFQRLKTFITTLVKKFRKP
ncbi:MAG: LptF/LptG family permease [Rikenellaceae bacterium]|jgi:lipopolysaccharide export system permease protein|nr:LptF/LptG family permease [Rikenellaceae bacterium]